MVCCDGVASAAIFWNGTQPWLGTAHEPRTLALGALALDGALVGLAPFRPLMDLGARQLELLCIGDPDEMCPEWLR